MKTETKQRCKIMDFKELEYNTSFNQNLAVKLPKMERLLNNASGHVFNYITFESAGHLVECLSDNLKNGIFSNYEKDFSKRRMSWVCGGVFDSVEKTKKHLINGSAPDGFLNDIEKLKSELYRDNPELFEIEKSAQKKKRRRTFSDDGGELNIDRYMSGEVEMWHKNKSVNKKPTAKIMINYAVSGGTSSADYIKNILCAVALVDVLQSVNVNCEIWAGFLSERTNTSSNYTAVTFKLKEANQPLDLPRLLSCCAPALFRYFIFNVYNNLTCGHIRTGLGVPIGNEDKGTKQIKDRLEFDAILYMNDDLKFGIVSIKNMLKEILI